MSATLCRADFRLRRMPIGISAQGQLTVLSQVPLTYLSDFNLELIMTTQNAYSHFGVVWLSLSGN